jgi:hypothetical protein
LCLISSESGDFEKIEYKQDKVTGVATYKNGKGEIFNGKFNENVLIGPLFKKANKTTAYKHVNVPEGFLYANLKDL